MRATFTFLAAALLLAGSAIAGSRDRGSSPNDIHSPTPNAGNGRSLSNEEDAIQDLPGMESFKVNFQHYSGYLQASPTRFLHYWFVTSQSKPETDPLVFWFNGGPGCSSLGWLDFLRVRPICS